MKNFSLALSLLLVSALAMAASGGNYRLGHTIKLGGGQLVLEHQTWAGPALASATYLKTSTAQTSTTILNITSFSHSGKPDFPRVITVTPTGTTANNGTCTITVTGTDIYGAALVDATLSNTATGTTTLTSTYAFNTVSKVSFPAACSTGSGVTWEVGIGSALGLNRCVANAGAYAWSTFDSAFETTRGTMTALTAVISGNLFAPNGTMNGTKVVEAYYVQDYSCHP